MKTIASILSLLVLANTAQLHAQTAMTDFDQIQDQEIKMCVNSVISSALRTHNLELETLASMSSATNVYLSQGYVVSAMTYEPNGSNNGTKGGYKYKFSVGLSLLRKDAQKASIEVEGNRTYLVQATPGPNGCDASVATDNSGE